MTDPRDRSPDDDLDRDAILARRRRFVVRALTSVGATMVLGGLVADCTPQPCLDIAPPDTGTADVVDAGDAGDAGDAAGDAIPQPCLSRLPDAGMDAGRDAGEDADAEPTPCLRMVPPDAGR